MSANILRQLKIKTGVVSRLIKEETSYEKEAEKQEAHIQSLIQKGEDEWTINKQKQVLKESRDMIPDTTRRLTAAVSDLELVLEGLDEEASQSNEAQAARETLKEAAKARQEAGGPSAE